VRPYLLAGNMQFLARRRGRCQREHDENPLKHAFSLAMATGSDFACTLKSV
jgi:hypothetical protein